MQLWRLYPAANMGFNALLLRAGLRLRFRWVRLCRSESERKQSRKLTGDGADYRHHQQHDAG